MNRIYVYWWTIAIEGGCDNYGDILAPFIAQELSGKKVVKVSHPMNRWFNRFIRHYVTVGSIISTASKNSRVWGSGIMSIGNSIRPAKFFAVRGPHTRKRILELGYNCPAIYGDPALILPMIIPNTVVKKFEIGIIPHYVDYEEIFAKFEANPTVKVIKLMTNDIVKTTKEILECEQIISSSLHGVIVSHAYTIPALWVKFSDKLAGDNIKFYDYFESLGIKYYQEFYKNPLETHLPEYYNLLKENEKILLPSANILQEIQIGLLKSCPFLCKRRKEELLNA
jgi:hypothetical protein